MGVSMNLIDYFIAGWLDFLAHACSIRLKNEFSNAVLNLLLRNTHPALKKARKQLKRSFCNEILPVSKAIIGK
jgi:hypothetical protein